MPRYPLGTACSLFPSCHSFENILINMIHIIPWMLQSFYLLSPYYNLQCAATFKKKKKKSEIFGIVSCCSRYTAYFWVHSLANLLYLRRKKTDRHISTKKRESRRSTMCEAFVLTCLCHSYISVLCLGLRGRRGLGHKATNIWTIKLEGRGKKGDDMSRNNV